MPVARHRINTGFDPCIGTRAVYIHSFYYYYTNKWVDKAFQKSPSDKKDCILTTALIFKIYQFVFIRFNILTTHRLLTKLKTLRFWVWPITSLNDWEVRKSFDHLKTTYNRQSRITIAVVNPVDSYRYFDRDHFRVVTWRI